MAIPTKNQKVSIYAKLGLAVGVLYLIRDLTNGEYADLPLDFAIGNVIGTFLGSLAFFYIIAGIVSAFLWLKTKIKELLSKSEKMD
jgi:hypothetical protein